MNCISRLCGVVLALGVSVGGYGQFSTPNLTDGQILASDYDNHFYPKGGTNYRIAWDNSFLYLAVSGNANFNTDEDALNIYIDIHNEIPVNSLVGIGTDQGIEFDEVTVKLPFYADYFGFIKAEYNSRRQAFGGSWALIDLMDNDNTYAHQSGADWIECAIPWSDITNGSTRPESFNFLMYLSYNNTESGRFRSIPLPNNDGQSTNPDDFFYFHVASTSESQEFDPFGKTCFNYHVGGLDFGYNTNQIDDRPPLPSPLYNMTVSRGFGETGEARLFMDDDIVVLHDLVIGADSRLQPGGTQVHTITLTGTDLNPSNFYNDGFLDANPNFGEKLIFVFDGNTILRGNGGLDGFRTRFTDIIVNPGKSVTSDAGGVLNAEIQFGNITNNGTFNMGGGITGNVNWTLRGTTGNTIGLDLANGAETVFNRLIIGDPSTLIPIGTAVQTISIKEDFEIAGTFDASNVGGGKINLRFDGPGNQLIKTFEDTPGPVIEFAGIEIASGGDVRFAHFGANQPSFEILDSLNLTSGRLFTIDEADPLNPTRYNLLVKEGAIINTPGVTSGYVSNDFKPCFVDGPLSIEILESESAFFPIGKNQDYRHITLDIAQEIELAKYTSEHFHASAAAFPLALPTSPQILNISEIRYWAVSYSEILSPNNVEITVPYGDLDDNDGVTQEAGLRLLYSDPLVDFDDTWRVISSSGGIGGQISSDLAFNFPYGNQYAHLIAVGNILNNQNPLPVTWLTFTGVAEEQVNKLTWSTASEQNNDYFEVQRSKDGGPFQAIGQVQGQGTTAQRTDYGFTDDDPPSGTVYYRLQQFDFDGASEFSETIAISRKGSVRMFPNPFSDVLYIEWEGNKTGSQQAIFTIWDTMGRKIARHEMDGARQTISTASLPHGSYIGELHTPDSEPVLFKLIK